MAKLTTHVLDTAAGIPAAGVAVRLFRNDGQRTLVTSATTNNDGRCDAPLLADAAFAPGTYELEFDVAAYFGRRDDIGAPFLDIVTLRFSVEPEQSYHVPLLVSPWSYATYRGS